MGTLERSTVTTLGDLGSLYAEPSGTAVTKETDHVNAAGRAFIAASPFVVLATGSAKGFDCSPKGDAPGFVQVSQDGKTLLIPDRRGNNRIDGLKNLIDDPRIGLLFFVPGSNETFRVNGRARISADPESRRRFTVDGKDPATVTVVTVEQAFHHCPKALVRSNLWRRAAGGRPEGVPTIGEFAAARDPSIDSAAHDAAYARRIPTELY